MSEANRVWDGLPLKRSYVSNAFLSTTGPVSDSGGWPSGACSRWCTTHSQKSAPALETISAFGKAFSRYHPSVEGGISPNITSAPLWVCSSASCDFRHSKSRSA